jgi:hypothetical protein
LVASSLKKIWVFNGCIAYRDEVVGGYRFVRFFAASASFSIYRRWIKIDTLIRCNPYKKVVNV